MTVTKSMERFRKVKERIRQAIISKGVTIAENASLSEMATKIEEINVGKSNKRKEKDNV
jgi:mannose/fructose/N-acetylgalactosamine-specific phosphotransferase system component IIB